MSAYLPDDRFPSPEKAYSGKIQSGTAKHGVYQNTLAAQLKRNRKNARTIPKAPYPGSSARKSVFTDGTGCSGRNPSGDFLKTKSNMASHRPFSEVIREVGSWLRNSPSLKFGDRLIRSNRSPRGKRPNGGV